MATLTLTLRQEAEIVTDLARGRLPIQIASRRHLPVAVVEACAELYGPDRAAWSRHSRDLNKRLRDEPGEDLDIEPAGTEETDDEPASREYHCTWPGCDHMITWNRTTSEALVQLQRLIDEHASSHRAPEPVVQEAEAPSADTSLDDVAAEEPPADEPDTVPSDAAAACQPVGSIDLLLDAAEAIGTTTLTDQVAAVRQLVDELQQLIDEHHATSRRRAEILAELDDLTAREQALYEELLGLGAHVADAPKPDQTAAVPDAGVWWDLPREVKARIRPWAVTNDVPHSITGRQPAATVAAYLAAHPEDDPRREQS